MEQDGVLSTTAVTVWAASTDPRERLAFCLLLACLSSHLTLLPALSPTKVAAASVCPPVPDTVPLEQPGAHTQQEPMGPD